MDPKIQAAAETALRRGLMAYDRRHGWRGPVGKIDNSVADWRRLLVAYPRPNGAAPEWQVAVVRSLANDGAELGFVDGSAGTLPIEEMRWARRTEKDQRVGAAVRVPADVVAVGDVILVEPLAAARRFALRQIPNVGGAVVAMDPHTGRVKALVGGWSYELSQFNRAIQAQRQPGSSFKPFVYLPALDSNFSPASLILDAPIVVDQGPGQPPWASGELLAQLLRALADARGHRAVAQPDDDPPRAGRGHGQGGRDGRAPRRGRQAAAEPRDGAGGGRDDADAPDDGLRDVRQWRAAHRAHADRPACRTATARPSSATTRAPARTAAATCGCPTCRRPSCPTRARRRSIRSAPTRWCRCCRAWSSAAPARRLRELNRPLGGKTGTTNDSFDAWFLGFSPDLAVGVWVGFDAPRTLGPNETGSSVAVPIFRDVMADVLQGTPVVPFRTPPGIRLVRINPQTGAPARPGERDAIWEAFKPGTEVRADQQVLDGAGQFTSPLQGISIPSGETSDGIY